MFNIQSTKVCFTQQCSILFYFYLLLTKYCLKQFLTYFARVEAEFPDLPAGCKLASAGRGRISDILGLQPSLSIMMLWSRHAALICRSAESGVVSIIPL